MLQNRDELLAASRPQPMVNVSTLGTLPYAKVPDVNSAPMAPPVSASPLSPPINYKPLTGSEPDGSEEPQLAPLMPASVLKEKGFRTDLKPLVSARAQQIIEEARMMNQISSVPKLLTADMMRNRNRDAFMKTLITPAAPETPEETESSVAWFTRRGIEGAKNIPGQVFGVVMDLFSTPWYVGAMVEGSWTGKSEGYWYEAAKGMKEGVANIKALGAPERDPEQTTVQKLYDPGIVIPMIADFGSQIASMFVGGGAAVKGLGLLSKGAMSVKTANMIGTAAGGIWGGYVEGQNTYFEAIEKGMTPGQASVAFAKHAAISGALSMSQLSFLMNQMPAPLQQKMLRRVVAGGWDAVTETLDETAGAWSLDSDLNLKEAFQITKDAFGELGTASFIVGMLTGNMGLPPEMALKAASANAVQSQINYAGEGKSVMDQVGEERLKGILEGEATYFRTVDGVRHSTIDGEARGGIVEGDSGYYWIPGRYGKKDGELLPIRLSDIVEVGTVGENAEDIVTHGSEQFQRLKTEADVTTSEIFGPIPQMRTKTFEDAYAAEREIAIRRIIAESAQKRAANQEAEFEKFTAELDAAMQQREAVADNVRGVENAVHSGMPEIGPDAPVAGDIPADIDEKMFAQLDKIAEAEWQGKLGTARWLGLSPEVRKQKKRETARRLAGLTGSVTKLQGVVSEGIQPAAPGTFAAEVEAMIANHALTGVSTPIDQLLEEDYVAKAVVEAERDIQAKLRYIDTVSKRISDSMVEDSSGNTYGLSAATFGPVAGGAPQVLSVQDVEAGADTLAQAKAAAPLPSAAAETVDMSSGDWTRVLLTYSGSENMMEMLKTGETTVEEVMMQAFQNAGKLKFVPDSGKKRLIATKGIAGQSDERYNASMMSFVRAVREAKTALHYVMENEYAEDYGLRDDRLENVGAMPPRAGAVGQDTLLSAAPGGKTTRRRTVKSSKSAEAIHGFAATMKRSNLYHSLVKAGSLLGWDDHYAAAEIASEIVYAQANAQVSAGAVKTVSEYYDKYLGDLVAEATEVTKLEYEMRQATQDYAIPKEMLFSAADMDKFKFVVAARTSDGTVYVGKEGQIHASLYEKSEKITSASMGYVDGEGKFYTRQEALAAVTAGKPELLEGRKNPGLDSFEVRKGQLFSEGAAYSGHEQLVLGAFDPASKDIELFLGSDLHTVLHEFAHAWRRSLSPEQLSAAGKWAHGKGWKAGDAWTVKGEERFAEGLVAWAGDSSAKAPKELEDVFEASAKYLSSIYSTGRALRPDVKTSAALSNVMEKIITKQLLHSANADDREEGRRRKRTREEFSQSKTKDLGDHIDMMAEFLNVPPQSARDKAELVEEMYARKRNPKYREELDQKLLEWEETGNPAIDLVDFLIVRDRAIEIRVKFENDFRDAYRKGPEAVNKLVDKMAKDRTHMDVRFYRMVAGDAGRRLQLLTNKATQIDTAVLLANTEKNYGAKSFDVLFSMMQDPKNAWNLADKMAGEMAPTMWDLYMQAYYGFRLSSPDVLAVNFFGTGLWTMWNYSVHRPFAGAIDLGFKAMSNITSWGKVLDRFYFRGNPRTRDHFNTSVLPLYAQLGRSVPYGSKLAKEIILDKTGGVHTLASVKNMDITTRDVNSWQRFTMRREGVTAKLLRKIFGASKGDMAIQKWEDTIRTLGPITAVATTFMRASDMMFKVIAVEGEMNRIAQEEAAEMFPRNPTAQAGWIKTRTASIVNDPGQLTPAQAERLSRVAEYNTFTDMPMKASRYVLGFRESLPIVKLVFPYFNTLVNLGKRGLEMVPGVGLGMEAMYRTDPEFQRNSYGHTKADIIAKQLEGAMFIAGVFLLLDDDELTGAAPEDPQERKHFYEAGKLEYAMKLGDTWYSYANIQPFNIALGMTANVRKYALANLDKLGSDSVEVQEKVTRDLMQAAWSVGSFMLNNDFMRSFEQYATAKTAERRAKVLGSTIESALIPYNGLLRWAMRTEKMMQNEEGYFVQQERDTLSETAFPVSHNLLNAIFGLPSTESNKLTVWGEPYHYADNKWYDTWLPVQYSKGSQDSVDKMLEELQYMPELPSRTYDIDKRGYQYDREIWQQLALGYGAESKPKLARLVESPGFQRKHKEDKVVAIQALLKDVRDKHVKRAKAAQRRAGLKPTGEER